jgi:hypothetical protein
MLLLTASFVICLCVLSVSAVNNAGILTVQERSSDAPGEPDG